MLSGAAECTFFITRTAEQTVLHSPRPEVHAPQSEPPPQGAEALHHPGRFRAAFLSDSDGTRAFVELQAKANL
jgi:hypothetical protein